MIVDGYTYPMNPSGDNLDRRKTSETQKKDNKNHYISRTILLNVISYTEYENITNKDSTKFIFDSLRMTREGN